MRLAHGHPYGVGMEERIIVMTVRLAVTDETALKAATIAYTGEGVISPEDPVTMVLGKNLITGIREQGIFIQSVGFKEPVAVEGVYPDLHLRGFPASEITPPDGWPNDI